MPVKLDYERDYYADLELPPTADATEVKKQYKKLGTFKIPLTPLTSPIQLLTNFL